MITVKQSDISVVQRELPSDWPEPDWRESDVYTPDQARDVLGFLITSVIGSPGCSAE